MCTYVCRYVHTFVVCTAHKLFKRPQRNPNCIINCKEANMKLFFAFAILFAACITADADGTSDISTELMKVLGCLYNALQKSTVAITSNVVTSLLGEIVALLLGTVSGDLFTPLVNAIGNLVNDNTLAGVMEELATPLACVLKALPSGLAQELTSTVTNSLSQLASIGGIKLDNLNCTC